MDTEILATSAVKTSISKTDVLSPFINEKDKEPSWDGNIYIFSNKSKSKVNLKRVPVQVKGTVRKNLPLKRAPKYSASVADMGNWLQDGGVILFVVALSPDGEQSDIFYSSLLPVKIRGMIERANGRSKINIPLRKFPDDNDDKVSVFLNFYDNMQKQHSFANAILFTPKELEEKGVLKNIEISITAYGKQTDDPAAVLFQDDVYLYANIEGSDIPQPLLEIPSDIHIQKTIEADVRVKEQPYYSEYSVIRSEDQHDIIFGKSTHIIEGTAASEERESKITFKPTGNLSDYIKDTAFFISAIEQNEIIVGEVVLSLNGLPDIPLDRTKNKLAYFKDVQTMLDSLGVHEELVMDSITGQDDNNIRNFTNSVVHGISFGFPEVDLPVVYGRYRVGNLIVLIWAPRQDDGSYVLNSFFDEHDIALFEAEDTEQKNPYPITHYIMLKARDFVDASNMDYGKIRNDLAKCSTAAVVIEQITLLMLEMLKAYDLKQPKDEELLNLAEFYSDWLIANGDNNDFQRINHYQIIRRRRELTIDEVVELAELRGEAHDLNVRCAAHILLNEHEEAQECFSKLGEDAKEQFMDYPINHFGNIVYKKDEDQ